MVCYVHPYAIFVCDSVRVFNLVGLDCLVVLDWWSNWLIQIIDLANCIIVRPNERVCFGCVSYTYGLAYGVV